MSKAVLLAWLAAPVTPRTPSASATASDPPAAPHPPAAGKSRAAWDGSRRAASAPSPRALRGDGTVLVSTFVSAGLVSYFIEKDNALDPRRNWNSQPKFRLAGSWPMDESRTCTVKAALILGGFLVVEGTWVVVNLSANPAGFLRYLGFAPGHLGTPPGWFLALLVTAAFTYRSMRLPSVRLNLFRPSFLKLLAILMAIAAGVLEEAVFRRVLMNYLQGEGLGSLLQILFSGIAFGVSHGIWGLFGRSKSAALGATVATTALGTALAVVYVVSERSAAACIVAHVMIDVFIEPGLVLAAIRGEMGRGRTPGPVQELS